MKIEIDWPEPVWRPHAGFVEVYTHQGNVWGSYKGGQWSASWGQRSASCSIPDPIKRRAEEIWQQNQKLESLTDEELTEPWLREYGHPCTTQEVRDFARAVVTADRKREAEIRERESGWQPIETAPKDGKCLLLVRAEESLEVMILDRRGDGVWMYCGEPTYCAPFDLDPTHWMPLPEVPNE